MLQNHDDGWSDDHSTGPQLSAFPARPSTPDQSSDNESYPHGFPPTPPTDEQTRPNDNTTPAFEPPPIPLKQHTWSASHAPTRNRVSLIYPSVRKDSQASPGDLWGIAFRKLVAQYNYKRIQKDQVRLIYLKPGQLDDTICISIAVLHQDQLGTLDYPYVALSYTWGKGEADATILVQDDPKSRSVRSIKEAIDAHKAAQKVKQFKVRTNLRDALRSVRLENETVAIWIDAICVDQSHTDERNEQVSKMNYIYERAYNVNIWLGCDAEGSSCSERAMKFIPEVIKLNTLGELLKDDTHIRSWASLFELLRWSW